MSAQTSGAQNNTLGDACHQTAQGGALRLGVLTHGWHELTRYVVGCREEQKRKELAQQAREDAMKNVLALAVAMYGKPTFS